MLEQEKEAIEMMADSEKISYKLCPRKFNKLRNRQIEKVYGDMGKQMLLMLP